MIRRVLDFVFVLIFAWGSMILGFYLIDSYIVPMEFSWMADNLISALLKVVISASMVFFWLWLWREIVKKMFWRTMGKN